MLARKRQLRMLPARGCTLAQYLGRSARTHEVWAAIIEPVGDDQSIYDRYLFAFLSINTPFEHTCSAFLRMRGRYWLDASEAEASIRQSPLVQYAPTKAKDIVAFTHRFLAHPESWRIRQGETAGQARDRLNVQGLGMAKLSFALCLLAPTVADVACCDRHIQRWATGQIRNTLPVKVYAQIESSIVQIGQRYGVSAFVAQWTIWDWQRGREETHAIIADDRKGEGDVVSNGSLCALDV